MLCGSVCCFLKRIPVVCVLELSVCASCIRRARTLRSAAARTTGTLARTCRTTPALRTTRPPPRRAAPQRPAPAAGKERTRPTTPDPRLPETVAPLLDSGRDAAPAQKSNLYFARIPCWSATNSTARHGICAGVTEVIKSLHSPIKALNQSRKP